MADVQPQALDNPAMPDAANLLAVQKHIRYCLMHLQLLPTPYESEDCSRMSLAFFVLSSLDLLGATDKVADKDRLAWIDWIYDQQTAQGGFSGGPSLRLPLKGYDVPHLAMTYTALANLAILGDDFSRLDVAALKTFVGTCQTADGSFAPYPDSPERDIRFVYCAFVIKQFIGTEHLFRTDDAVRYILTCQSHDGAFGQTPGSESQGGTTYCALASLHLAKRMSDLPNISATIRWASQRLVNVNSEDIPWEDSSEGQQDIEGHLQNIRNGGFQGRPEKDPDVCYSFWVGASLRLLEEVCGRMAAPCEIHPGLLALERYEHFILATQSSRGGIGKSFDEPPDIYHTYLGLAGLAVGNMRNIKRLNVAFNITVNAALAFALSKRTDR